MMDLNGKNIDDFFRKELSNGNIPFEESHWLSLEKRLKKKKRKRIVAWITTSGIAAMLLLALSVSDIFFNKEVKKQQPAVTHTKEPVKELPRTALRPENNTSDADDETIENTVARLLPAETTLPAIRNKISEDNILADTLLLPDSSVTVTGTRKELAMVIPDETGNEAILETQPDALTTKADSSVQALNEDTAEVSGKSGPKGIGAFSVAVVAGPDINGVNNLRQGRGGLGMGLILGYRIFKNLSVSTGAVYAKKLYNTPFDQYKPNSSYKFPVDPESVSADCRVLDIPLNIDFTAWSKQENALVLSTGVSSYLMLDEGYYYSYKDPSSRGPRRYYIDNRNRHYLGILNFGATYQRKIADDLSIGIQPYLKLPITDIGYGNVRLLSTGIATSVKFNFPAKKN